MASYWASWKDYCDASIASLIRASLANTLPWSAANTRTVTDDLAHITPYPPLPSEVILRILASTLPAPSYTHAHERTRLLKSYALLSRDAARWATLLIRRDVACSSVDAATSFVRWAVGPAKTSRGALLVQSVRYGSAGKKGDVGDTMWARHDSFDAVRHAATYCPTLSELWLSGMNQLELKVLRHARALRSLYMHEIRLFPLALDTARPLVLPDLTTLYLSAILSAGPSFSQLLSPSTLPSLRHLDLFSVHRSLLPFEEVQHQASMNQNNLANPVLGGAGMASITASLAALSPPSRAPSASGSGSETHPLLSIAPQLYSLTLGPNQTRTLPLSLFDPLFSLSTHLTLLSLPLSTFLSRDFPHLSLPSSLTLLRLTNDPDLPAAHLSPSALFERESAWRSSAFGELEPGGEEEGVPLQLAFEDRLARRKLWEVQRREGELRKGRARGVEALGALGESRRRYLVLPGGLGEAAEGAYAGTGAEVGQVVELEGGGEVVVFSEDPAHERKDGAFRLGTERWRRFVERPCADSLL
ncbi:hypothetical protein JCM10296v2_006495 [Rhodotorula toruloides]